MFKINAIQKRYDAKVPRSERTLRLDLTNLVFQFYKALINELNSCTITSITILTPIDTFYFIFLRISLFLWFYPNLHALPLYYVHIYLVFCFHMVIFIVFFC